MIEKEPFSDRRQHIRLDMEGELVDLIWQDEEKQQIEKVVCLDISRKGIKVKSQAKLEVYTPVEVILNPSEEDPMRLKARVIRNVLDRDGDSEIAMLFLE